MGCFSFLCKECGKGIQSNSFTGQECELFLLENGVVTELMKGRYDSYGRVFNHTWDMKWHDVVDLMFDEDNLGNGIAAVHVKCFKEIPTTRSESDPNQGWGDDGELFGDSDPETEL
jgi:hypothetical protein